MKFLSTSTLARNIVIPFIVIPFIVIPRIVIPLIVIPLIVVAASCVGSLEEKFPNRNATDASPFGDPLQPDADVPGCSPIVSAPANDGNHFPGEDCVACHRQGTDAPPFTIGGTLYVDVEGTAPLAGATIVIDDATGNRFTMITAANGNFYSTELIAFPIVTYATVCPDVVSMISSVPQTSASCNSGSCHSGGFRVFLP